MNEKEAVEWLRRHGFKVRVGKRTIEVWSLSPDGRKMDAVNIDRFPDVTWRASCHELEVIHRRMSVSFWDNGWFAVYFWGDIDD